MLSDDLFVANDFEQELGYGQSSVLLSSGVNVNEEPRRESPFTALTCCGLFDADRTLPLD